LVIFTTKKHLISFLTLAILLRCVKNREPVEVFHGNRQRAQHRKYWDDHVSIEEITHCSISHRKVWLLTSKVVSR